MGRRAGRLGGVLVSEAEAPELAGVRPGEELDWAALEAFVRAGIPELQGSMEPLQFPNGAANLTYLLRFGDTELVLRRPPFGVVAPGAHDMKREFRVLSPSARACSARSASSVSGKSASRSPRQHRAGPRVPSLRGQGRRRWDHGLAGDGQVSAERPQPDLEARVGRVVLDRSSAYPELQQPPGNVGNEPEKELIAAARPEPQGFGSAHPLRRGLGGLRVVDVDGDDAGKVLASRVLRVPVAVIDPEEDTDAGVGVPPPLLRTSSSS